MTERADKLIRKYFPNLPDAPTGAAVLVGAGRYPGLPPGNDELCTVRLLYSLDGGPPIPWRGELELPGAERVGDAWRFTLPQGSLWFGVPVSARWSAEAVFHEGAFTAALFDPDSGERLTELSTARVAFHLEVE